MERVLSRLEEKRQQFSMAGKKSAQARTQTENEPGSNSVLQPGSNSVLQPGCNRREEKSKVKKRTTTTTTKEKAAVAAAVVDLNYDCYH